MTQNRSNRRNFFRKLTYLCYGSILPENILASVFPDPSFFQGDNNVNTESDTSITSDNMSREFEPGYLKLHRNGELRCRAEVLWDMMHNCRLCPRECEQDRISGQSGDYCNATSQLQISSFNPHFGEEEPLVGTNGSGTIFFTNCAMLCVFCINWEISQYGLGQSYNIKQLSDMMLNLQKAGCHNINVVTPTHYSPHILFALDEAAAKGLRLPVAYNTSGWERLEILQLLDGVIDIYLTDFKYHDPDLADKYSPGAVTYPEITKKAVIEMNRQVGVADAAKNGGILKRGLIIRHLVMPNNVGGTADIMKWIAGNLPKNTYINLMSQYTPAFKAHDYPDISRRITVREYQEAVRAAYAAGLTSLDIQGT